jgi:Flp pilus assembly pilin Flp
MKAFIVPWWMRFSSEDGQALAEYALLLTFIAAVCVLALTALGLIIAGVFSSIVPAF